MVFSLTDQRCHHLDHAAFTNGRITITPTNQFAAVARYECHDGYVLRGGDSARVCQGDGTWSGQEPSCHFDRNIGKYETVTIYMIYSVGTGSHFHN